MLEQDTLQASAPYDSIWAATEALPQSGFERTMLADDKLMVVLGVVLIIWIGLVLLLLRNDRRLRDLEAQVGADGPVDPLDL